MFMSGGEMGTGDGAHDIAVVYPHLALRNADDTAAAALLAVQSQQLLSEITPALSGLLELVPGAGADVSLLDAVPELRLKFFPPNRRRLWTPSEIPAILHAFAALAHHAQRLHAFPALKTQFWLDVLRSEMAQTITRDVQQNEFMRATFPQFVVDFGGFKEPPRVRNAVPFGMLRQRTVALPVALGMDEALGDALVAFMTTPLSLRGSANTGPVAVPLPPSLPQPRSLSMGFVFNSCSLRVASLEILERFLERTFASATRQFDVHLLEISDDVLMPPDLDVLARIVRKCVCEYDVDELRLDQIIPQNNLRARPDYVYPQTTPAPFLDMVRTVFSMETLPALASRPPTPTARSTTQQSLRPSLRRLSMNKNYLCLELFATRFSALRYGCSLEADVTTYVAKTYNDPKYEDYWRWLAFGLFYPRPKRFANRLRLRTIGHIEHCPLSAAVFARTIRNPAVELIFGGRNEHGGTDILPMTELLVCVVKAGARVEVFQTGKREAPEWSPFGRLALADLEWTDTLPTACELEAIYERADGSVCVVLPGVGLGWVRAEDIERIEREPLSAERSEQDGQFTGDLGWDSQWFAGEMLKPKELNQSMQSMVEILGRQFYSLSFGRYPFQPGFLPAVLAHCTHVRQLSLRGNELAKGSDMVLVDALSGELGDRLEVLNLSYTGTTTNVFFDRLFSILSDVENPPALRELRLGGHALRLNQLEALDTVLQVNSTLALVEVHIDQSRLSSQTSWETRQKLMALYDRMKAEFHGQPLHAALDSKRKLAFLSVVRHQTTALDEWTLTNVFSFAAEHDARRMLVWNGEIHPR